MRISVYWLAHRTHTLKAGGSNPSSANIKYIYIFNILFNNNITDIILLCCILSNKDIIKLNY
jgi:hypothetical protein